MPPVIQVREFSFRYRGDPTWALRDVDLIVEEGDRVLLTGPTGSGKSTLLRALNGLLPDFYEGEARGTVSVAGLDVLPLRPNRVATFVGSVFQTPEDQIIARSVSRDVAFGLENLGWDKNLIATRVGQSLEEVGLGGMEDRATATLSGGQVQRLALASALAMGAHLLLLDEPASDLDPQGRQDILETLEALSRTDSRSMVITDHRLEDLARLVDRIVVLHQGRIALDGTPREVMSRPELDDWGVEVPPVVRVWRRLRRRGLDGRCPLTSKELAEQLNHQRRKVSDALEAPA